MDEIITVQNPFPGIRSIRIYRPVDGPLDSKVYAVSIDNVLGSVRKKVNAMWVNSKLADQFADEVIGMVGNLLDARRLRRKR